MGGTAAPLSAGDHAEATAAGGPGDGDPEYLAGSHRRGIAQSLLGELRVFSHRDQDAFQQPA